MSLLWNGVNLFFKAGKLVLAGGDNCGCCTCDSCSDCTITPCRIKIVFHDVEVQQVCQADGGTSSKITGGSLVVGGKLSGEIVLPQSGDSACKWQLLFSGKGLISETGYAGTVCDPAGSDGGNDGGVASVVRVNATTFQICISSANHMLFMATVTTESMDCMTEMDGIPNDIGSYTPGAIFGACSFSNSVALGKNGTIDLIPLLT